MTRMIITCSCGQRLQFAGDEGGREVDCPSCGQKHGVPPLAQGTNGSTQQGTCHVYWAPDKLSVTVEVEGEEVSGV